MEKFLGVFDLRPLYWFHYVPLVAVVALFYFIYFGVLPDALGLLSLYLGVSVSDQLVHAILGVD